MLGSALQWSSMQRLGLGLGLLLITTGSFSEDLDKLHPLTSVQVGDASVLRRTYMDLKKSCSLGVCHWRGTGTHAILSSSHSFASRYEGIHFLCHDTCLTTSKSNSHSCTIMYETTNQNILSSLQVDSSNGKLTDTLYNAWADILYTYYLEGCLHVEKKNSL